MKKRVSGRKLNRTANERTQLFRQLTRSLVDKGFLVTTQAKAAAIRPQVERLVSQAKNNGLIGFRRLVSVTGNIETARRLVDLGALFAKRQGGYTRTLKIGRRSGDDAELVRLEWVEKLAIATPVVTPAATQIQTVKTVKEPEKLAPKKEVATNKQEKVEKPKKKSASRKKVINT